MPYCRARCLPCRYRAVSSPVSLRLDTVVGLGHPALQNGGWRAVDTGHEPADAAGHAPGGFVGHAEFFPEFGGGNAVPGRGEQIDRIKPQLQRGPAVGERRACGRVEMMTAPLAGDGAFGPEAIPPGAASALGAPVSLSVADRENVLEAHLIVREHLEEFSQGDRRPSSHATRIAPPHTVWQRDNGNSGVAYLVTTTAPLAWTV